MDKRPNIIMILSDDQGAWAMGNAGNSELITPTLDKLAAEGINFKNFFCASPVCSPARASILTGRIPSQHGVHDWLRKGNINDKEGTLSHEGKDQAIEYLAGIKGYSDYLSENGYNCGLSGKWHLGDSGAPQKGFDYWYVHGFGGGNYYDYQVFDNGNFTRKDNYVTYEFTDKALEFIEQQKESADPFYLSVHYTAPHSPWDKANHPEDIWALYNDCPFESTPNIDLHPDLIHFFEQNDYDQARRKEFLQGYFSAITAMDLSIGKLLDKLDETGARENTIIIFTSDNGMNMGHHGIWGKGNGTFPLNMYDSSVKVPFIISWPGHIKPGIEADGLYSHYDIFPTLLDYLGIDNPDKKRLPGSSFAGLLNGAGETGRESVIIYDEYGPVRMIRTRDWKYIHRYPYGPHELYDLNNDPDETENLITSKASLAKTHELCKALQVWFNRYVIPELDGIKAAVTGAGQLDRCNPGASDIVPFSQEGIFDKYNILNERS
jgi:choline-sulfatase